MSLVSAAPYHRPICLAMKFFNRLRCGAGAQLCARVESKEDGSDDAKFARNSLRSGSVRQALKDGLLKTQEQNGYGQRYHERCGCDGSPWNLKL